MRLSDALLVRDSDLPRFDRPPVINGESVLVIGDAQIPRHDAGFLNNVLKLARSLGIRRMIWGGDMVDFASISIFLSDDSRLQEEIETTETALAEIASGFFEVNWIMGNHEARFMNALSQWLSLERVRRLFNLDKVQTVIKAHDYFHILVGPTTFGGGWRVTHPRNSSEIPARVAVWLAEKNNQNVAMLHNHIVGTAQTRDGTHIGIDVGMTADPLKLDYAVVRDNKRPAMVQGALILRYGRGRYWPLHLSPLWTDWDYELSLCKKDPRTRGQTKRK